jgi:prepilin-type N-terminal cleavage/methylation domain-containing protein
MSDAFGRSDGFSLVEAIVALAIVSLTAMALVDLIVGAADRQHRSMARWGDLSAARSIIERQTVTPLSPGRHRVRGEDGGVWWVSVGRVAESARVIRLSVSRSEAEPAILTTLRIASEDR